MCAMLANWQFKALHLPWAADCHFPLPVPPEIWAGPMTILKAFLNSPRLALVRHALQNKENKIEISAGSKKLES